MSYRFLAIAGLSAALLAIAGGFAFIYSGIYNVAATEQHTAPVFWAMQKAMERSVKARTRRSTAPPRQLEMAETGFRLYAGHCVQCHGAPGIPPDSFALGMTPLPANLVQTGRQWSPPEIHWVIKNGIKMTGMPAWEFRLEDDEIWALTAFIGCLPELSPADYRQLTSDPGLTNGRCQTPRQNHGG